MPCLPIKAGAVALVVLNKCLGIDLALFPLGC